MPRTKQVTTAIYCNKYNPDSEGNCVISIRVTADRRRRYYDTGTRLTEDEFKALYSPKLKPDQKIFFMALNAEEQRAEEVISKLGTGFTFDRFEKAYTSPLAIAETVADAFAAFIDTRTNGKRENYQAHAATVNSFRHHIAIADVTAEYLQDLALFLSGTHTPAEICKCMAAFREVLEWLLSSGVVEKENYPIGWAVDGKYEVPVLLHTVFTNYANTFPDDQYSTKTSYETARNTFERFRPGTMVQDVTPEYLNAFEQWMLKTEGNSLTSVGIYCRSLRSVINSKGVLGKILHEDAYPFGKSKEGKYDIPVGSNPKKALPKSEIAHFLTHACDPGSMQQMAKDYWTFLYVGNGMNMKDMLVLKWSDWTKEGISFIREKTKRTKREAQIIKVVVQPIMVEIIQRWGNANKAKGQYIFPHLEPGMTAKQIREKVQLVTKLVNKYVDQVCEDAGITKKVRTGEARDSFATVMKNSGAPGALISELMGHGSEKTTAHYFGRFENDQQEVAVAALTSFLNEKTVNE